MLQRRSFLLTVIVLSVCIVFVERHIAAETKPGVSVQDVKKETTEALQATKEYTAQHKEEFHKTMHAELDRMQKQIDHLTAKANQAKKGAQVDLNKVIRELQRQKDAAGEKLQELKSASAAAWDNLKSKLTTMMEDLERSYKRALSRLQ